MRKSVTLSYIILIGLVLLCSCDLRAAPDSYEDTFIHTHASVAFTVQWEDEFVRQVKAVRPDVIEIHTSFVLNPDTVDDQKVRKSLFHALRAKELADELDFNLSLTINLAASWRANTYDNDERFVFRINPDGSQRGSLGQKAPVYKRTCRR